MPNYIATNTATGDSHYLEIIEDQGDGEYFISAPLMDHEVRSIRRYEWSPWTDAFPSLDLSAFTLEEVA
jgi:hypothetical protein